MSWRLSALFSLENQDFSLFVLMMAFLILVVIMDQIGQSRNDKRLYRKATIIGAIGIVFSLIFSLVSFVYQTYVCSG